MRGSPVGEHGKDTLLQHGKSATAATPLMALIVHKYGGTSMGSTERIRNVAKRVAKWVHALSLIHI